MFGRHRKIPGVYEVFTLRQGEWTVHSTVATSFDDAAKTLINAGWLSNQIRQIRVVTLPT